MIHVSFLRVAGLLVGLLLLPFSPPAVAQAPAWQSARAVGMATAAAAGNFSEVRATAVDAAGNVYLAGYFTNTVALGSTTLTSLGRYDVFVAKFNPVSNQFVWAQRAGGISDDRVDALTVSGTSIYIAGYFAGPTAGFGTTILTNGSNPGYLDVFVAKLTDAGSTGAFAWAQRAGGTGSDQATALAVSGSSVYVAGTFYSSTANFGPAALTCAGRANIFVAKLTDTGITGSFTWVQQAGGTGYDYAEALAVSGTNVYLAGNLTSSPANFGPTTLITAGATDVFVAKLTDAGSTGAFAWAQRAGGTANDQVTALAASGSSVYVAGSFNSSTAGFGPATLTNAGGSTSTPKVFVAKLTDAVSTGDFAWAQQSVGTGNDQALALVASGTSVYVAGQFSGPLTRFGLTTIASGGNFDVFVAKLTDAGSTGAFAWAQRAGGTGSDQATALAVSSASVYVAGGSGSSNVGFGTTTLPNSNSISFLGFLASLTDPTLTATATAGPREPAALFPNPARGTATLRLPAGTPSAPLTLTDALGRAVRRYPAPAGPETALDLSGLPAGLYLLRGAGPAQRLAVE